MVQLDFQKPYVAQHKNTKIAKALGNFFILVGFTKLIELDEGSDFISGLFQQVIFQLCSKQIKSSAFHPEFHGALERFHSTLKKYY